MTTSLGVLTLPWKGPTAIAAKSVEDLPAFGFRLPDFDTWRATYGGATVLVVREGTTEHAPLYADPGLTTTLPNPQTLLSMTGEDGTAYGKWAQPVYTYVACYLSINDSDKTGVQRPPLYFVDGTDLSPGMAASTRGTRLRNLEDVIDAEIYAEAFGSLAESNGAEANTAVLEAAIGAAAAQGAGVVRLPAG